MKSVHFILSICMLAFFLSCNSNGREIDRVRTYQLSTTSFMNVVELELDLKKDQKISFWNDIDMYYEDSVDLKYRIKILKNNRMFGSLSFDPRQNIKKTTDEKVVDGNKVWWKIHGKGANYTVTENANYTFEFAVVINNNQSFRINHADLIIKR